MRRTKRRQAAYERGKKWYVANRQHVNDNMKGLRLIRRAFILEYYGGKCKCCMESNDKFLAVDHINGGGNKHYRETRTPLHQWLWQNGCPDGFQILCHNCNMAKSLYGTCHEPCLDVQSKINLETLRITDW